MGKKVDRIIEHFEAVVAYHEATPPTGPVEQGIRVGWREALNACREIRDDAHHVLPSVGTWLVVMHYVTPYGNHKTVVD